MCWAMIMVMKSIDASWSTLVQVKNTQITGLMPTLVIFLMYSPECNFIVLWMIKLLLCMASFKVILSKITSTYPRGHWVNYCHFVFSQMTSSWFWVPSPIIWLHGRCSRREVCSFALDDSSAGEKLSWFIRHLSDGLYRFYINLWKFPSDIWA